MNRYTMSVLFALPLALSSIACLAAVRQDSRPFFFVQMADPQFGMFSGNKDTVQEEANFRAAAEKINRLRPAFVLISGDLVNTANDPEQIRAFQRSVALIDAAIPVHLVAGNHDMWGKPLDKGIEDYGRHFGRDHYAFTHGGTRFIVLNSNVVVNARDNPERDQAQRWWFAAQLKAARAARADHIVVCTHHPWFLETPDEKDQYFNVPSAQRAWYLDRMRESGVELALAGHLHRESSGTDGRLRMITTGPIGQPLGKDPSGLRIVRVTKDSIESRYHGLDDIPDRVHP